MVLCEAWVCPDGREIAEVVDIHASTKPVERSCRGLGGEDFIVILMLPFEVLNKMIQQHYQGISIGAVGITLTVMCIPPRHYKFTRRPC